MHSVSVFLDYANINAASTSGSCKVNYGELLRYLADDSEGRAIKVAYAYVPIDPRREHAMDETISDLWGSGYIVRSKVGTLAGNSYKCDFDVEMTLDMVRTAFDIEPDIVVIASGDSDFIPVVELLRNKGIRVEVASFARSMSRLLDNRCSGSIYLDALIEDTLIECERSQNEGMHPDVPVDSGESWSNNCCAFDNAPVNNRTSEENINIIGEGSKSWQ